MVEQCDNFAFNVGSHINNEKYLAAKGAQSDDVFGCDLSFTIATKSNDLGDDECVDCVVLGLAQVGIKRQPVIPCCFHAEFSKRVEFFDRVHEF